MGFVFREARAERNPSPAALRIAIDNTSSDGPAQLRVLKCRGGIAPVRPLPFSIHAPIHAPVHAVAAA